jgi:LysR family glycine cleavage system transcriptional activator
VQSCELAYYFVHRKDSEGVAHVVAFKEWLLSEVGARTQRRGHR